MSILTEKALAASLKKLLEKKTLNKITVKDITDDCGVNRQTFYYHFHDVYDLVEWIFTQDAMQYTQELGTKEWREVISTIMEDLQEEKSFIMNAYYSLNRRQLEEFLKKLTEPAMRDVIRGFAEGHEIQQVDLDFIVEFQTLGLVAFITEWIAGGMRDEYRDRLNKLFRMLSGTMDVVIANMEEHNTGE